MLELWVATRYVPCPALISAFIATSSLSCCMEAYIDRNQPPQWSEPACLLQPADLNRLLHLVSELSAVVLKSGQGGLLSLLNTYRNVSHWILGRSRTDSQIFCKTARTHLMRTQSRKL